MEKTAGRFFEIPKRKEKLDELLEDLCVKSWTLFPLASYLIQLYKVCMYVCMYVQIFHTMYKVM